MGYTSVDGLVEFIQNDMVNVAGLDGDDRFRTICNLVANTKPTEIYALCVMWTQEVAEGTRAWDYKLYVYWIVTAMIKFKHHKVLVDLLIVDVLRSFHDIVAFLALYDSFSTGKKGKVVYCSCVKRGVRAALPLVLNEDEESVKVYGNVIARKMLKIFHPIPLCQTQETYWGKLVRNGR